jgi:hypothetical protein
MLVIFITAVKDCDFLVVKDKNPLRKKEPSRTGPTWRGEGADLLISLRAPKSIDEGKRAYLKG